MQNNSTAIHSLVIIPYGVEHKDEYTLPQEIAAAMRLPVRKDLSQEEMQFLKDTDWPFDDPSIEHPSARAA